MTGRTRLLRAASHALVALGAVGLVAYWVAVLVLEPFRPQNVAWGLVFLTPLYGVGVLAYASRPDLPIARLLMLGGSSWAAFSGITHVGVGVGLAAGPDAAAAVSEHALGTLAVLAQAVGGVAQATAISVFGLYPDGRYQRRYERWLVRGVWTAMAAGVAARLVSAPSLPIDVEHTAVTVANPVAVPGLAPLTRAADGLEALIGNLILLVLLQMAIRYRRADPQARRQLRWLLLVPLCALALGALGLLLQWSGVDAAWFIAGTLGQYVYLGLIPAVLLISILRHRLLDVDVIIRKSLVYGTLLALIGVAYVATAATVGLAANAAVNSGDGQLPVAVAVLLAVRRCCSSRRGARWNGWRTAGCSGNGCAAIRCWSTWAASWSRPWTRRISPHAWLRRCAPGCGCAGLRWRCRARGASVLARGHAGAAR